MSKIVRLTLFKIPNAADLPDAAKSYSTLAQDAQKDGKPYIISSHGNQTYDDPRAQGYNFVARTVFESKADMDYYDNECSAHAALKNSLKSKTGGPPLVVYVDGQ
ncbi:hypothetical protein EJ04DRAFT_508600 [Polyplosphaeria fusca]|uniref:Stress-response A/B barrel domain-containing protein n=1 Tax=Polyplosphaeria fusca TaxID=682080 RepID=A0A9P4R5Z9_9PLEO|nr:hypothetical protein EJ04DRAFT_508600 [Polyplosphaeria fusca]